MKKYTKLFEEFSEEGMMPTGSKKLCCNPLKLLIAFENQGGDSLRRAAFHISDFGFEGAERMAEDPEDVMAIRALRSCSSSRGVDAIAMLDMLEDMRFMIDDVAEMLNILSEEGEEAVMMMKGGPEFLKSLREIEC